MAARALMVALLVMLSSQLVVNPTNAVSVRPQKLRGEIAALQLRSSGVIKADAVQLPEAPVADAAAADDPDEGAPAPKAAEGDGAKTANANGVNVDAATKAIQDELKAVQGDMAPDSKDGASTDDAVAPSADGAKADSAAEAQATAEEQAKEAKAKALADADADLPLSEQKIKPKSLEEARDMCKEECAKKARDEAKASPEEDKIKVNGTAPVSEQCIDACVQEKKSMMDPGEAYASLEKKEAAEEANNPDGAADADKLMNGPDSEDVGNSTTAADGNSSVGGGEGAQNNASAFSAEGLMKGMTFDASKYNMSDPVDRVRAALAKQETFVGAMSDAMKQLMGLKKTMPQEQFKLMMLKAKLMDALRSKDMGDRQQAEQQIVAMRDKIAKLEQHMIKADLEAQRARREQENLKAKMSMDEEDYAKYMANQELTESKNDFMSKEEAKDQEASEQQADDHASWASGLPDPGSKEDRQAETQPMEISAMADAAKNELADVQERLMEAKKRVEELEKLKEGLPDLDTLMHQKAAEFHIKMKEAHEQSKAEHEQRAAEIEDQLDAAHRVIEEYERKAADEKKLADYELEQAGGNSTTLLSGIGDIVLPLDMYGNKTEGTEEDSNNSGNGTDAWDKMSITDNADADVSFNVTLHPTPVDKAKAAQANNTLADALLANSTAGADGTEGGKGTADKVKEEVTKEMTADEAAREKAELEKLKQERAAGAGAEGPAKDADAAAAGAKGGDKKGTSVEGAVDAMELQGYGPGPDVTMITGSSNAPKMVESYASNK